MLEGREPLNPPGAEKVEGDPREGRWHGRIYGGLTPGDLARFVAGTGRELIELRRMEGTLEDVFVHLTQLLFFLSSSGACCRRSARPRAATAPSCSPASSR